MVGQHVARRRVEHPPGSVVDLAIELTGTPTGITCEDSYCVQLDAQLLGCGAQLQRMTTGLFKEKYPAALADRVTFLDANSGGVAARSGEGELWRWLAAALLAGLLLESLLAWRFGRR